MYFQVADTYGRWISIRVLLFGLACLLISVDNLAIRGPCSLTYMKPTSQSLNRLLPLFQWCPYGSSWTESWWYHRSHSCLAFVLWLPGTSAYCTPCGSIMLVAIRKTSSSKFRSFHLTVRQARDRMEVVAPHLQQNVLYLFHRR